MGPEVFDPRFVEWTDGVWAVVSACIALGFADYISHEVKTVGWSRLRLRGALAMFFYHLGSCGSHATAWFFRLQAARSFLLLPSAAGYIMLVLSGCLAAWAGLCIIRVFMSDRWGEWSWIAPIIFLTVVITISASGLL